MTKIYVFESFTIEDLGGGNPVTYKYIDVDNTKVSVDYRGAIVDDSQELADSRLVEFTIETYDDSILSDSRVTKDAADVKGLARITLNPVAGGLGLIMNGVRLNLSQKVSNRACFYVKGRKRGILQVTVDLSWGNATQVWGTSEVVWGTGEIVSNYMELI